MKASRSQVGLLAASLSKTKGAVEFRLSVDALEHGLRILSFGALACVYAYVCVCMYIYIYIYIYIYMVSPPKIHPFSWVFGWGGLRRLLYRQSTD